MYLLVIFLSEKLAFFVATLKFEKKQSLCMYERVESLSMSCLNS